MEPVKFSGAHAVIALMGVVIAVLLWTLVYFARDELRLSGEGFEEQIETADAAGFEDGRAVVHVSVPSQQASGIATQPLAAAESEAAIEAFGTIVGTQPLFELRGRYLATIGDVRAREAAAAAAEAEYRRMRALYRDDRNVSEQAMRNAQARFHAEQAQLEAARVAAAAILEGVRTGWGDAIARWVADRESTELSALLGREAHLLQLVLPYGFPAERVRDGVRVSPVAARAELREARYVSDSPQADATLPGLTHFFLVRGADLRTGARMVARIGTQGEKRAGVRVPNEAVVWNAGKAWAYVKIREDTFARYEISTAQDLGDGWFHAGNLQPGDPVVVSGAQLLLSEEFKYQIRNENED